MSWEDAYKPQSFEYCRLVEQNWITDSRNYEDPEFIMWDPAFDIETPGEHNETD